jgi:hypothetical protein
LRSRKPSLYAVIGGRGILQNFPYWFSDFLQLLGLIGAAIDPTLSTALDRIQAILLLELTGTTTNLTLDTVFDCIRAFLLLKHSITATNLTINLAFDRIRAFPIAGTFCNCDRSCAQSHFIDFLLTDFGFECCIGYLHVNTEIENQTQQKIVYIYLVKKMGAIQVKKFEK